MEYQLIAGIFFGVGICITGILIYNIIQSYAFDRNTRRIMHEELERKIFSISSDNDRMFDQIISLNTRLEELEKKSNTKKKAQ
jgi:hypothetical protein